MSSVNLTNHFLIAMPAMTDPNFAHTLTYICRHSDDGALGVVVNRPIAKPSFDDLLEQLEVQPVPPLRRVELFRGGPVDSARGFVLHTSDWTGEGSLLVDDQVALTSSLDVLKAFADGAGPKRGLLALGYAGWAPGQLEREITANGWLNCTADEALVFDPDIETKYDRAMRKLGVDLAKLSSVAGHA